MDISVIVEIVEQLLGLLKQTPISVLPVQIELIIESIEQFQRAQNLGRERGTDSDSRYLES